MSVKTWDEFKRWLESQPENVRLAIASRAALRALPIVFREDANARAENDDLRACVAALAASAGTISPSGMMKARAESDSFLDAHGNPSRAARLTISAANTVHGMMEEYDTVTGALCVCRDTAEAMTVAENDPEKAEFAKIVAYAEAYRDCDGSLLHNDPLWLRGAMPPAVKAGYDRFRGIAGTETAWRFWFEWYGTYLSGQPMNFELLREIATEVGDEEPNNGPERVAQIIERVQRDLSADTSPASIEIEATSAQAQSVVALLNRNRTPIALQATAMLEAIAEFRERIRALNSIDPELREEILAFVDKLSSLLHQLLDITPEPEKEATEDDGKKGFRWLNEFRTHLTVTAAAYVEPKNIAEAAVPTTIILGCTAVGALVGMPVAGTVVGGLLTGQLKPGKAVEDLTKPSSGDE